MLFVQLYMTIFIINPLQFFKMIIHSFRSFSVLSKKSNSEKSKCMIQYDVCSDTLHSVGINLFYKSIFFYSLKSVINFAFLLERNFLYFGKVLQYCYNCIYEIYLFDSGEIQWKEEIFWTFCIWPLCNYW